MPERHLYYDERGRTRMRRRPDPERQRQTDDGQIDMLVTPADEALEHLEALKRFILTPTNK